MNASSLLRLCAAAMLVAFAACNQPSAEKAFDVAVLNTNMIVGFAHTGMERALESPSAKMGKTKDEVVQMKREEVVDDKRKFAEANYEKLKAFSQTDETKDIIQKSIALHELVLPVYKNEYMQLAKLYDSHAAEHEVEKVKKAIHNQYFLKFEAAYNELINSGQLYAKKHGIEVRWEL
ncbi:MAG TPA: hypothetical protein VMR70_03950 [Flavisolibacter sp.]|nr:hypothetical protein [Flavisolibacter sp.]